METVTVDQYLKHAEHFGVEEVFETAQTELSVVDLAHLSHRLAKIEPRKAFPGEHWPKAWKLLSKQRRALVHGLILADISDNFIAAWTDAGKNLIRSERAQIEAQEAAEQAA